MLRQRGSGDVIVAVIALVAFVVAIGWYTWTYVAQQEPVKPAPTVASPSPSETPKQATHESIVADLNKKLGKYAVSVTLSPLNSSTSYSAWSELTMSKRDVAALQEFAGYLAVEFSKYPVDLVKNSGLKTIGIVRDLKVSGTSRASVPAPMLNAMVYDAVQEVDGGKDYASSGISHEYWHYLDYKIRGDYRYGDAAWTACNPAGFSYGAGGETAYNNPDFKNAFYDRKNFITEYSTYGIEEDRAEMFAWLMYVPERVKSLNDAGIDCKTKRLTTIVRALSPQMSF